MFADLHLHTSFSDGTFAPEELAARGKALGVAAMAVTDHDTAEGCERMARACDAAGMGFVTGAELTAEFNGNEVHVLAYGFDLENAKFRSEVARFQAVRQDRIREMVARLNEVNIPLDVNLVFAIANCRSPGRPHVARALVQSGFCASSEEAFDRFLKINRPAFVPKHKMSALEAIQLIQQAGGIAAVAHPGLNRTDLIIGDLADAGLDGLECYHSKHTRPAVQHYLELAERYHLLVTGGSDCHGTSKGKPLVGSVKLPYRHFEMLKERLGQKSVHPAPSASDGVARAA